jgi:hypothetical protein
MSSTVAGSGVTLLSRLVNERVKITIPTNAATTKPAQCSRGEDAPSSSRGVIAGVRPADVLAYRERSSAERRAALDRMVEIADEADMYERTATPKRTR